MKAKYLLPIVTVLLALAADSTLVEPRDVADEISARTRLAIIQVGPNVLYRSKHIPGAVFAGPASTPEGLRLLKDAAGKLPRDREIVIYCGCCPWDKCPNIKPAMEVLREQGFSHVRAIHLPSNFKADWIDRGYPVQSGGQ
jgi:thiosulfate/3-mercaptopyruvate sulfurtransferase